ncbi:DUF3048 domain-containing protein [Virgibacillus siamensis]|uniref:DUF3048 domain-containing protein n=1 Tax=Virgibacillus siamensis TaxID=480071 RepID=UPI000987A26E|nr:DUF3048 domain-containing protein [Virgibacillus siamensis]
MKRIILILISLLILVMIAGCQNQQEKKTTEEQPEKETVEKQKKEAPDETKAKPNKSNPVKRVATTGVPIKEADKRKNYFGVIVENSVDARPHTGLVNADVVYEMEVEYNITRFLALFHSDIPEKIGPVRSARHYFLPIFQSWNAPFIHYGGTIFAYNNLKRKDLTHLDGIGNGNTYFERDNSRAAPHNAYLITDRLPDLKQKPRNPHFEYTDKVSGFDENVSKITINYSDPNNVHTSYQYDKKAKVYRRILENKPHTDRVTGTQIKTKNLFILYAKHRDMATDGGYIHINFNTKGELDYYVNEKKINGKWKNIKGNIVFFDGIGHKIKALPGKTWIQVVDKQRKSIVEEKGR